MTAKLIVSVKEVNGIAQVVYYCKERRRIYRKSFADTVREFRDAYRKANKKISCNWRGLRSWATPSRSAPRWERRLHAHLSRYSRNYYYNSYC